MRADSKANSGHLPGGNPSLMARLPVRILLTLLVLIAMPTLVMPDLFTTLSLGIERDAQRGYVVTKVTELPLPPPLQVGDMIDLPAMTIEARAALVGANNLPLGLQFEVAVRRDGQPLAAMVQAVPDRTRFGAIAARSALPISFALLALFLLTLWRGRDWAAWGLCLFAFGIFMQNLLQNSPLPIMAGLGASIVGRIVNFVVTLPGLYLAAEALAGAGLSPALRRGLRIAFIVPIVLALVVSLTRISLVVFSGIAPLVLMSDWNILLTLLPVALPLIVLAAGYRRSEPALRLRIRWVFWSLGLLFLAIVLQSGRPEHRIWMLLLNSALLTFSIAALLYGVLRHRLVDVSFVVDRTLVYGLTTGLVVGVFALLEQLIERLAIGTDTSVLLQAGVTLVVAVLLNRVHRRVEDLVDRLLFRDQHRSTELLREFGQQCAAVESSERLLPLAVERIVAAIGDAGVAIYERAEAGYVQLVSGGSAGLPATVDVDDAVFLALRSSRQPVPLSTGTSASALGPDGWAFPMSLHGEISGALVCLPPPGAQFAPDQRAALADLAHELSVARHLLRARAYAGFVSAVAAGELDAPGDRARQLLGLQT